MIENAIGHPETVETDDRVEDQEQEEVLIVVQSDTCVHPYAMMVKFLAAHVAEATVFGASRLWYLTSLAPIDRAEEDVVAVVAFHGMLKLRPLRVLAQVAGVSRARLIVTPITGDDQRDRNVPGRLTAVRIRQMAEAVDNPQVVASNGQDKVHDLDHGVRLVAEVVRPPPGALGDRLAAQLNERR